MKTANQSNNARLKTHKSTLLLMFASKKPHSFVMLLVTWKRLIFGPPFLFQISNDVQPHYRGSLVNPKFAHLINACKVMAQLAVAHPVTIGTSQQEKFDICRWAALWKKYAGAKNRAAMAALLSPVQRVAEQSKLARELLDFSSVFLHILIRLALGTRLSSSAN